MNENQKKLFDYLEHLSIETKTYFHEPVFTVGQAQATAHVPATHCKNLFLKDSKKRLWLIVALHDTTIQLKAVAKKLEAPELRFASPELLMQHLKVIPGSVTPLALINDTNHEVLVVLDSRIMQEETIGCHPLENNATTVMKPADLQKFINACGNRTLVMSFD
jgi:Ala-tRNA(Pro) deacylase